MKKMLIGAGVLVLVAAAVSVYVFRGLDGLVANAIEQVGSDIMGTQVTVAGVEIDLLEGRATIRQLLVSNPSGFTEPYIFSLTEIAIDIEPASLSGPVYVLDEILIRGAKIVVEYNGSTTNIQTIQKSMDDAGGQGGQGSSSGTADGTGSDVKLMVKKFTFAESTAKLSTKQWGEQALRIPTLNLVNLGTEDKGLTPEELAVEIVKALAKQVQKATTDKLKDLGEDVAREKAQQALEKQLGEKGKATLDSLKSLFKD